MAKIICNKNECTGCAACYNICHHSAISMIEDNEGFLFPSITSDLCVNCGLCRAVCPNLNPVSKGNVLNVYAAWNNDDAIRQSSSSGGLFYTIAQMIIREGGVVFGAVWSDNIGVVHSYTESIDGLAAMQGSKYLQSEIGESYRNALRFLEDGRKVLFTGTPCQIAGLKGFLGKQFDNLLTVDIICHGTPSQLAFKTYLRKLEKKWKKIDHHDFVFRDYSKWNTNSAVIQNGVRHELWGEDSLYFKLFIDGNLHRESCYSCHYACSDRVSDITIGDFWGIGRDIPFKHNTDKGCSLVLCNTIKGDIVLNSLSSVLFTEHRTLEEALVVNTNLYEPSARPSDRDIAYSYLKRHSLSKTYYKFYSTMLRYYCHRVKQYAKSFFSNRGLF